MEALRQPQQAVQNWWALAVMAQTPEARSRRQPWAPPWISCPTFSLRKQLVSKHVFVTVKSNQFIRTTSNTACLHHHHLRRSALHLETDLLSFRVAELIEVRLARELDHRRRAAHEHKGVLLRALRARPKMAVRGGDRQLHPCHAQLAAHARARVCGRGGLWATRTGRCSAIIVSVMKPSEYFQPFGGRSRV